MRLALALALLLALAAPLRATIFVSEDVDLLLPDGVQGEIRGASLRVAAKRSFFVEPLDLRLITGTRTGDRVTLEEWDRAGHRTATISARIARYRWERGWYEGRLRGTWTSNDRAVNVDFGNIGDPPSLFTHADDVTAFVFDRMHDNLRARRWTDATFDAQLVCAIDSNECGWLRAIPALAAGRMPAAAAYEPWLGFAYERVGKLQPALFAGRNLCKSYSRIGCLFYADLAKTAEAFHLACRQRLVRCAEYWGAREIALIDAAWQRNEAEVERLLRTPVNVNAGGEALLPTALQTAAMHGSLAIVKQLVARGATVNVNQLVSGWFTPLFYAITGGHEDVALFLLDHGARIDAPEEDSLLWRAAFHGERAVVRKILAMGEHPDRTFVPAGSALTAAVQNRDVAIVEDLLAHGADPDFTTRDSRGSPIDYARRMNQAKILRLLLAARKEKR